ncbi:MAG: hypothetical protein RLP14_02370 [Owenweeksia sp.]
MIKKSLIIPFSLLLCAGLLACKKIDQNPEYTFTVIVKTLADSTRIQNSLVEVYVPRTVSGLSFTGYSDELGEITFEYDKDAVFQVRASRGRDINGSQITYTYIGCTFVRLEPNDHVYQTVYIQPYDPEAEGCVL